MAISIISLLKIFFLQFLTLSIFRQSTCSDLKYIYNRNLLPLLITAMLIFVIVPNYWIALLLLFFTMIFFGRMDDHSPGVFLFLVSISPSFSFTWMIGSTQVIDITTQMVLGLAAIVVMITNPSKSHKTSGRLWPIVLFFAVFDCYSNARGSSLTNVFRELMQTLVTLVLPVVAMINLTSRVRDFRVFIIYGLATAATLTAILLFESFNGWSVYRSVYAHVGLPPVWDEVRWRDGLLRASGPIMEATSMGFVMALFAIFAWCSRGAVRSKGWRYVITAIVLCGVYVTQSRNPWVGLSVALAAYVIFWKMNKTDRWAGYVIAVLIATSAITVVFNMENSTTNNGANGESTLQYRKRLFDRGIEEVIKNPVFGTELKNVKKQMNDLTQGEGIIDFVNSYLYVALVTGASGLMLFILTLLNVPAYIWSRRKHDQYSDKYGMLSFGFCISIATITMVFFTFFFSGIIAIYLMLLATLVWTQQQSKQLRLIDSGLSSPDSSY